MPPQAVCCSAAALHGRQVSRLVAHAPALRQVALLVRPGRGGVRQRAAGPAAAARAKKAAAAAAKRPDGDAPPPKKARPTKRKLAAEDAAAAVKLE